MAEKRSAARERMRRRVMYLARTVEPLRPHGYGPGRGNKSPKRRRRVSTIGGNRNKYLAARIARDRPDVLERMKRGEFDTVQAAAIEAGIVRPKHERVKAPNNVEMLPICYLNEDFNG